ncbi:MAG: 5-methyltetrahydropteroyltriglutamate--homocysteine methyltransferase [Hyphomicrobiales bacterium]|nr:5-methyltetrahydropteroyltriglutamate--homocysteine methyltransferase [Hyphomicrobiales bacterium]
MRRSEQRILTTHTGSLPRPLGLTRLYAQRARGEPVDASELRAAGRAALHDIVPKQVEAGIDIGNNGEQQRDSFLFYIRDRLSGLGGSWQRRQRADVERYPVFMKESYEASLKKESVDDIRGLPKAIGAIGYPDAGEVKAECADFRATLDAAGNPFAEAFLTAPSPGMVSAIVRNEHYKSEEDFLGALGSALRVEYKAIVDAGFLLQLDCPDLAREKHNTFADRPLADFIAFGHRVVDAINAAIHDIPPERVRLHVCWGNYEGPHDLDVELQHINPFLKRATICGFVLPFSNPRHAHEYRYLKDLIGKDQIIVAGVIDSTTNFVEHPEVIAERLENVAETIGEPRRVMAGSDCGFETIAGRGRVAEDVVWAKFKSMAQGAELASSRLF